LGVGVLCCIMKDLFYSGPQIGCIVWIAGVVESSVVFGPAGDDKLPAQLDHLGIEMVSFIF